MCLTKVYIRHRRDDESLPRGIERIGWDVRVGRVKERETSYRDSDEYRCSHLPVLTTVVYMTGLTLSQPADAVPRDAPTAVTATAATEPVMNAIPTVWNTSIVETA